MTKDTKLRNRVVNVTKRNYNQMIWLISESKNLAKYQECLKTDSIPAWCEVGR